MTALILQPPELVQQLIQIARQRKTTPESLLNAVVHEFVQQQVEMPALPPASDRPEQQAFDLAFEREVANFMQMLPTLLPTYENRVVAIYQGQVIACGDDILPVYNTVVDMYGEIPCYVQRVSATPLRKVRIPTAWKRR
jgi:hypothetical protein